MYKEIDYFLPGIKPTGKPFQVALVGVIAFRGDKLTFEYASQFCHVWKVPLTLCNNRHM